MTLRVKEKKKRLLTIGPDEKEVILHLAAVGGIIALSIIGLPLTALFAKFCNQYFQSREQKLFGRDRELTIRMIKRLQRKRLVKITRLPEGYRLELTEQGKHRERFIQLETMHLATDDPWDGRWRIVGFDIRESHRHARDALRDLLKQLGFFSLQKSVWVVPWPCRDEIEAIREAYGLNNELWYGEADTLDQEVTLREYFTLLTEKL